MSINTSLGLTPIYLRMAAGYLSKGEGTYPCSSFGYDRVKVTVEQQWNNYALEGDPAAYFMVTRVAFYARGECRKWVEFKSHMISGGSKEPGLQVIENTGDK